MAVPSVLILVLVVLVHGALGTEYTVKTISACEAEISHKGKVYGTVDITSLDSGDPTKPKFTITGTDGYTYDYNPCTGLNVNAACNTFEAVCQSNGNQFYAAGRQNFTTFKMEQLGEVVLEYVEDPTLPKTTRHSLFKLRCAAESTKPNITFVIEAPSGHYNFIFGWSEFCSEIPTANPSTGISVGSILLIVFFPSVIAYFVIGFIIMKMRGADGMEMIPNSTLWFGLPGLIKGGCLFVISPCRGGGGEKSGYDSIP